MRIGVVGLAVVAALGCSRAKPKPLQGLQLVYDIDLDVAVEDRARVVKRDMEALLADNHLEATIRVVPTKPGAVSVEVADPKRLGEVTELVRTNYKDMLTIADCAPAVCLQIADPGPIRKAALERAVTAIKARVDKLHVTDPVVVSRGEQIVIEVGGDPNSEELVQLRSLVARGGRLEMKVVDDCAVAIAAGCTRAGEHTGSAFMKRLYAFASTDDNAKRVGIRADVDSWIPDEGGRHTDYYLRADDRTAIERYVSDLARRDPAFKLPDDHELGFELVVTPPDAKDSHPYWRSYYLERATRMTGADISDATATTDPNTNRALVLLDFGRTGGAKFGDLTSQIVGMKLATILDGTIKSAPFLMGPITGGRASITMGGGDPTSQQRDRDELIVALKSGALPAPLREASVTKVGP